MSSSFHTFQCREGQIRKLKLASDLHWISHNVLWELQSLSLNLQKCDTFLVEVSHYTHQTIKVPSATKPDQAGKTELKIKKAITSMQFKEVDLTETEPKKVSVLPVFYQLKLIISTGILLIVSLYLC